MTRPDLAMLDADDLPPREAGARGERDLSEAAFDAQATHYVRRFDHPAGCAICRRHRSKHEPGRRG